jgi:ADP-ribose pyrophosphatase YjhB (NUDIX family)
MKEKLYENPSLAVDAIVTREIQGYPEILLIERKNAPYGWAFPGGFVDVGESTEAAVCRELHEEVNLYGYDPELICVASDPQRDPRQHVVSVVYKVQWRGTPEAADDAKNYAWFDFDKLPTLAFDHAEILEENMDKIL